MAAFADGVLIATGLRERLEYVLPHVSPSGITGAPAVSRTLSEPRLAEVGQAAVRCIDPTPHGVYFVDLKEDETGAARVTEINAGRCGTTVHFYTRAGYNFPAFLVELASGTSPSPLPDPHAAIPPDLYWVRTLDCGPALIEGDAGFDRFPRSGQPT
jgi:carbamoyl-phosphate synthase large subunit